MLFSVNFSQVTIYFSEKKIVWRVGSKIEDEDRMLDLVIRNDASIASYITDTSTMRTKRGKDFFSD